MNSESTDSRHIACPRRDKVSADTGRSEHMRTL